MLHKALSQNMPVVVTSNTIVALELYPIPWAAPCATASTLLQVCPPGSTKLSPPALQDRIHGVLMVQSLPASCPWTISSHRNHTSPAKSAAGNSQLTLRPR